MRFPGLTPAGCGDLTTTGRLRYVPLTIRLATTFRDIRHLRSAR